MEVRFCKDCRYSPRRRFWIFKWMPDDPYCNHPIYGNLVSGESTVTCRYARHGYGSNYCGAEGKLWEPIEDEERTIFFLKKK